MQRFREPRTPKGERGSFLVTIDICWECRRHRRTCPNGSRNPHPSGKATTFCGSSRTPQKPLCNPRRDFYRQKLRRSLLAVFGALCLVLIYTFNMALLVYALSGLGLHDGIAETSQWRLFDAKILSMHVCH